MQIKMHWKMPKIGPLSGQVGTQQPVERQIKS